MPDQRRLLRLENVILQTVGPMISHGMSDPRLSLVTVTRINLSHDLSVARVNWSSLGEESDRSKAAHALEHARGHLQSAVARNLRTRVTPRLEFHYDESIEKAMRLSSILDRIAKERAERGRAVFLDERTMRFHRTVQADAERIWRAITSEEERAVWLMPSRMDLRVSGECTSGSPDTFGGVITEFDPPRVLQIGPDSGDADHDSCLRFEIGENEVAFSAAIRAEATPPAGSDDRTAFQPGGPGTLWTGALAGWHSFLDRLTAHVEERPVPPDEEYAWLLERYVEILRERFPA